MSDPSAIDAITHDVILVGGGLVGASLALALAPTRLRVALVESVRPEDPGAQPSFDDRTTALGNGTRRIFEALGVWPQIAPEAAPIAGIHVSDAGRFGFARLEAADEGIDAFGYVVSNRVLGRVLWAALDRTASVERFVPARARVEPGEHEAVLDVEPLEAGGVARRLRTRLVVAADGGQSLVRSAAGIAADVEDYEQVAVIAHVETDRPSAATAWERFTASGPIALLPLANGAFGMVWTLAPADAQRVLALDDARFLAEFQQAFGWRAGQFRRVGRRASYPLKLTRAERLTAPRTAVVGNAAQALHPVAGQGFNLGLRDAATLAEVLAERAVQPGAIDVGAPDVLRDYAARRTEDRDGVLRFTDGLVKLFGDGRGAVAAARNLGLLMFDLNPVAKRALSRVSWGFGGRTPRLARGLPLVDPERAA